MTNKLNDIESIFKEHHARLCNIANNIVNDRDNAKDIVQDVFYGLWQNRQKVDWNSSLYGYLVRATTNRSINWLEKNNRNSSLDQNNIEPIRNTTEDIIHANELQEKIKDSIERFPPRCKAIFVLSRYEGMKYTQIAEHLDISIKTVENQMSIALSRLRNDLKAFIHTSFIVLILLLYFLSR